MATPDLTVHGAGILGLSVAWAAARRGARARVIETARPGAGSSGGLVGALSPHVPENWNEKKAFQLDSLLMAEAWWQAVAATGGRDPGYARTGRLQPLADAAALDLARSRAVTAATLWQGRAEWAVIPTTGAAWEPASPSGWLVRDTLSARLHPRQALAALVTALKAKGCEVTRGETGTRGPQVWATGVAGLATLTNAAGRPAGTGVKGQAATLRHDARTLPQIFTEGLHIVPHADGTVAIGSTSETTWQDPTATDPQLDLLIEMARIALPCLAAATVLDRWAGLRPRARTRAPVLGHWPGRPGHYILNGGFKIGFGMAPKLGETLADLILEGRCDAIPDSFRPEANL
ncbi:MAG: NAD(P)/FAD-dependent oxidoreductase [Pseudorhodobacter sp.]